MGNFVVGIDIGGTTTSLGFVDRKGLIAYRETIDTQPDKSAEQLVMRVCDIIDNQCRLLSSHASLSGIGIGAPNANYLRGTVESPPNLNWGTSTDLVEKFRSKYNLPVAITNDANAAALGELQFGGAIGMKNIIVITLGTGLGSGIISDGQLVYGADGFAGELGHTTVDPDGRECACGKSGCLETYVSATGICRTLFELLGQMREPSLLREKSFAELTSKQVCQAANAGDHIALTAFDKTARILGMKLADAVAHTSPEAIFLSGGLAEAGELIIAPTRLYLEKFLFAPYRGKKLLLKSQLQEGSGAVLGAAALAWHEVDSSL